MDTPYIECPYEKYWYKTVGSKVIASNDLIGQLVRNEFSQERYKEAQEYTAKITPEIVENIIDKPESYKDLNQPIGEVPDKIKKAKQEEPVFLFDMSNALRDVSFALKSIITPEFKQEEKVIERKLDPTIVQGKKDFAEEDYTNSNSLIAKAVRNSGLIDLNPPRRGEFDQNNIGVVKGIFNKEENKEASNDFIYQIKRSLDKGLEVMKGKSHDYASKTNRYSNFEQAAKVAGTTTEQAILTLIGIKIARISELINAKKDPKNESLQDSYMDLINYICILNAYGQNWQ